MSRYSEPFSSDTAIVIAQQALALYLQQPLDVIVCTPLKGDLDEAIVIKGVHEDRKYIVKVFDNKSSGQKEAAWTQHASDLGIGPKLYYADPTGSYFIIEFVRGSSLIPGIANVPAVLKNMGQYVARLHHSSAIWAQPSDVFARVEAKYHNLQTAGALNIVVSNLFKQIKNFEGSLRAIDVPMVPCQNDLNPRNIFVHNDQVTIIDWGDASLSNPMYDIAVFFVLNVIEPENEKFFYEEYDPKLLEPEWQAYMRSFKNILRFEFALNLLLGVQAKNPQLLSASTFVTVNPLSYYLTLFAEQEIETDTQFCYEMALASLNEFDGME